MARFNLIARLGARVERWIQTTFNYGSVEGVLYIKGEPAPAGLKVSCDFVTPKRNSDWFTFDGKRCKTSIGGRFRFSYVPAGEVGVGKCHCDIDGCPNDVDRRVEVRTGETTVVDLGKGTGCVKGRFVFPHDLTDTPQWKDLPLIWMECLGPDPDQVYGRQLEFSGDWRRAFYSPDTWRQDDLRWYLVRIDDCGEFEISGAQPGHYGLKIEVQKNTAESERVGLAGVSALGFYDFVVGHTMSGVLDLGAVELPLAALEVRGVGDLEGEVLVGGMPATSGIPVRCQLSLDFCDNYPNARMGRYWFLFADDEQTETDESGRFRFRNLPAGLACIGVVSDADDGKLSGEQQVKLLKGKTVSVKVEVANAE